MRREAFKLMQRYMTAIYTHTTVNHDHLFVSLLRSLPFSRFSEDDFRRRSYLLSTSKKLSGLYRHQNLEIGQVALLTDDRRHKFREFLSLALETGVIRRDGSMLIKDSTKFSSPLDFNRARIDNPIGVIANEVLPLKELQREVLLTALIPPMFISAMVHKQLLKRAEHEFEADYLAFFRTGESKSREIGRPYLLRGTSRRMGVVLVHGFLAAPREMAELADYLWKQGLWVAVIRLKGHGTLPEDLALRTVDDWQESVDSGYAALKLVCEKVALVGFSLGGGLALDAALRNGDVSGVVAISPPLKLHNFYSKFASSLTVWNKVMTAMNMQQGKREFVDLVSEHPDINYHRLPVAALAKLGEFMEELEEQLPNITSPTLIIQSLGDPVVDPDGTWRLFEQLASPEKEYLTFDFKRHGILKGEGSEKVHVAIGKFIEKIGNTT